jgi:hypothetical protein
VSIDLRPVVVNPFVGKVIGLEYVIALGELAVMVKVSALPTVIESADAVSLLML